ncbi:unnamed protein product [Orchesella dallaii]|uniref:Protein UXT n=1 Tax=Orchesella dallaii TaxID=48710 RepID=A0ABP1QP67_9HEXA
MYMEGELQSPIDLAGGRSLGTMMDKVTRYEEFLNEVLRKDLKETLERREEVYCIISEYMELQTVIEKLEKAKSFDSPTPTKLRTRVEIGCNFYVQANITDVDTIIVDVGCGIWLPMNRAEAIKFISEKLKLLNAQAAALTQQELQIKAKINIVLQGIRELQGISAQMFEKAFDPGPI